ncbi:zinc-binding dehydrogenase [Hymenobacter sp. BT730]|uniref:quinone oxidoreductase family protein n=1 Tax=Hymenobacter sp. BT730 TaxID=3063332 RepID=UPI0026E0E130|nr:zinc-binding dehydrogenase [Hymenobacter sp. BT730]
MQALVLEGISQPLQLRDVPTPTAGPGQLLVHLHAAALNHRDVWIQHGQYAGLRFPCILGSDGAGVVSAVGEGVDPQWLGQKVLINPGHNWGENPRAQGRSFAIVGLPEQGTFAEFLSVPLQYVHPMPQHLSFAQAAALPLAGVTAYRATFTRAGLQAQERVLITGIGGGVALLAMQMAVARGAQVWVTSGSDEKIARAVALGAQGGINYKTEGWAMTIAKEAGGPFDVIVDSAAGPAFAQLLDVAAPGGRIVFYGGTLGTIPQVPPAKIFWKQLSILGSTMGTEQDFAELLALVTEHQLHPVVDEVLPLAEGEAAMRRMDNGQQFGKIVLQISHE